MNGLTSQNRVRAISYLVEGNSLRAMARLTGAAINTVVKLLIDAGRACSIYQDGVFRGLPCKKTQCDEVWTYHQKNRVGKLIHCQNAGR
jgi:hypothetical protein